MDTWYPIGLLCSCIRVLLNTYMVSYFLLLRMMLQRILACVWLFLVFYWIAEHILESVIIGSQNRNTLQPILCNIRLPCKAHTDWRRHQQKMRVALSPPIWAGKKALLLMVKSHFLQWNFCTTIHFVLFTFSFKILRREEAEMDQEEKQLIGEGVRERIWEKEGRRKQWTAVMERGEKGECARTIRLWWKSEGSCRNPLVSRCRQPNLSQGSESFWEALVWKFPFHLLSSGDHLSFCISLKDPFHKASDSLHGLSLQVS